MDAVCRVLTHDGTVEEVVTDDSPGNINFAEPDTKSLYGGLIEICKLYKSPAIKPKIREPSRTQLRETSSSLVSMEFILQDPSNTRPFTESQ